MKNLLRSLTVASILIIPFALHVQNSHSVVWQSPCVLTESQKAMLTALTHPRTHPFPATANIVACVILREDTFLLRYTDGHLSLNAFGFGDPQSANFSDGENSSPTTVAEHRGNEQEHQLFLELETLSPDDLARSDALVQEIFKTTPADEIQLAVYGLLGMRGNRYIQLIESLQSLSPEAAFVFYTAYIGSSLSDAYSSQTPKDSDKQVGIDKVLTIFETTDLNAKFSLNYEMSQEIKRIDPASYERLKAVGVVIENAS